MSKVYAVCFNNGAEYAEDNAWCVVRVHRAKESAEKDLKELSDKLDRDVKQYNDGLTPNGDANKSHKIRMYYEKIIHYGVDIDCMGFFMEEYDFIE